MVSRSGWNHGNTLLCHTTKEKKANEEKFQFYTNADISWNNICSSASEYVYSIGICLATGLFKHLLAKPEIQMRNIELGSMTWT